MIDILNEECVRGNSGNDINFVGKVLSTYKEHACVSTPKIRIHDARTEATPFTIKHYAGPVLFPTARNPPARAETRGEPRAA